MVRKTQYLSLDNITIRFNNSFLGPRQAYGVLNGTKKPSSVSISRIDRAAFIVNAEED